MSFAVRHRSVLAYANGFPRWDDKAGAEPLDARYYVSGAADMVAAGDIMMVSGGDGAHAGHRAQCGRGAGDGAIGLIYRGLGRRSTSRSCHSSPAGVMR